MERIHTIAKAGWGLPFVPEVRQAAVRALEQGSVVYFPSLNFSIPPSERRFLDPSLLHNSKNIGYNPATNLLGGTNCEGKDAVEIIKLIRRFSDAALSVFERLLPYGSALQRERASLRPAKVEGRVTSWRKDDTLLHVDSFPSNPSQGRRLLRLFCNVNPHGKPRTWRLGEPFPKVASQFWPTLTPPQTIKRHVLSLFRITKGLRSEYDHYMLQLHDAMKADEDYQKNADQIVFEFPAGSAWGCFTDQASHAATAGQHQFEQTFTVPVEALVDPSTSPLAVLERLADKELAPRQRRMAA